MQVESHRSTGQTIADYLPSSSKLLRVAGSMIVSTVALNALSSLGVSANPLHHVTCILFCASVVPKNFELCLNGCLLVLTTADEINREKYQS